MATADARAPAVERVVSSEWSLRDRVVRRALVIGDTLGFLAALVLATALAGEYRAAGDVAEMALYGIAAVPAWVVLFKLFGLYDRDVRRMSHAALDELPWIAHASLIGCLGMWTLTKVLPIAQLTLAESAVLVFGSVLLILSFRVIARRLVTAALGKERMLLVGVDEIAPALVEKLGRHPEYGVEPLGILAPAGSHNGRVGGLKVLGAPEDFGEIAADLGVERAIVCRHELSGSRVIELIEQARRLGIKVGLVPDTVDALGFSVEVDDVEGVTILGINPPVLSRTSLMTKRAFDLVIAALVAPFALVIGLIAAVAIRIESKGPIFFTQTRVGYHGRRFRVIKFRTMQDNAEQLRDELMNESADPHWLHLRDDPRVTPVGRFLRRTSIDELPQVINVIRGDMSIVGPRPLLEDEHSLVSGWGRNRQDLAPGITGLWQVLGRTEIPFEEMVKLDYMYVTNWSLWLDVKLLLRTVPAVLARRGVN